MLSVLGKNGLVFAKRYVRHLNSLRVQQYSTSDSSAYDGDGKTTIRVLNNDETKLNLINSYSARGFRLSNKLFIEGSILVFPTNVFSWNVPRGKNINMESLLIFDIIVPKVKMIVIGYGQLGEEYDASIPMKLKRKGITCELLPTPHAATTYNYLVSDGVHVAGAFIPVKEEVAMSSSDIEGANEDELLHDKPLFDYEMNRPDLVREDITHGRGYMESLENRKNPRRGQDN